jgi:hypothetical protein
MSVMAVLPGIPTAFADDLQRKSGLAPLPVIDAGTPPKAGAEIFRTHGIVAIRGALTGDALTRLRTKSAAVMEEIICHDPKGLGSRGPKRYSFGGSSSTGSQLHHPEWAELIDVPAVTATLDEIWGSRDYACHTAGGDFCLSGAPGHQNLHADAWFKGCETLDEVPRIAVNYLVEDQTPFNGPLRVVPGTHRKDVHLAPTVDFESEESILSTMCPLPAGTALVRDLRTWHGGTPNLSTSHRAMPNAEFTAPSLIDHRIPKAMPHSIWEGLSDRGKHLARYLKAEPNVTIKAHVDFDIKPGGNHFTQSFFNGLELAPLFEVCHDALASQAPSRSWFGLSRFCPTRR